MRIVNLNPTPEIGASGWFVELDGHRILLDAGMHPKIEGRETLPLFDRVKHEELDAIAISHCHHDHVGALPVAVRHWPKAHVLMTELSYFLVERVLHNSVNVMKRQRDERGLKDYPLFSHEEVDDIEHIFQGFKYNREVEWAGHERLKAGFHSPTLEFYDAGHALGSAGIMLRGRKETLFFTGDVCFQDQTILKGARFEDIQADVLILETTRGNRELPAGFTRESEIARLTEAIRGALKRRGSVLLPTFALGRTQEMLALLAELMAQGKVPQQSVFIGGLGRVFTEIYDLQSHRTHRNLTSLSLTEAHNLVVLDKGQSEKIKLGGGRIFVITAGMMSENTAAHDLAVRMVGDPNQSIFFVGYADPDTPAGRLRAAKEGETFHFSPSGGQLTKKCDVREFDLTAHANRDELLDFVSRVSPRAVVLAHGDVDSKTWFRKHIHARHPRIKVVDPQPGEEIQL